MLNYCDVCALPNGSLAFVHDDDGPAITCDGRWRLATPEVLLQIRCGVVNGTLVAVGKGNASGHALVTVDGNPCVDYGPSFGDSSVAIGPDGVYVCRSDREIHVLSIAGVFVRRIMAAVGSQGIRDVTPLGELRTGDDWFRRDYGGLALSQPVERDLLMVGQFGPPDQIAGALPTQQILNGEPVYLQFTAIPGEAYNPHIAALAGGHYAICARTPRGPQLVIVPPYPPFIGPAPDAPIGPIGPPRGEDGRLYDLQPFIVGAPETWPRSGPTHPMHQTQPVNGVWQSVKFGPQSPIGHFYEMHGADEHWIYLLEDASNNTSQRFTDPRWYPRRMAIGLSRAFATGEHRVQSSNRGACGALTQNDPFSRRMWLFALWDRFACGPDLQERAVVALVYDPTAGVHTHQRMIELNYYAHGAGWFRWESHYSDRVYATAIPTFNDSTRENRSDFYRFGDSPRAPVLTGCVQPVLPKLMTIIPCALKEPGGYLNWRWGGGQSLTPPTHPADSNHSPFEHNRPTIGGHETCALVQQPNGLYAARSPNGRAWLSRQTDGSLQERATDAAGQPGSWETGAYVADSAGGLWAPPHGPAYGVVRVGTPEPPAGLLPRLRATRAGFVTDAGQRVFLAGVSAFMHYERFLRGTDIDSMLRQAQDLGSNCLRVFGMAHYIPVNAGRPAFNPKDFGDAYFDRLPEFCAHVAGFGQYVYWSVFPDGNIILPGIDQQRPFFDRVVAALKSASNALGELTNEQDAHSFNTVDPRQLTRPSGIAFTSGSYGDIGGPQPEPWDFVDYHTPRDWPIKAVKDSCVVDHPNYVAGLGVMLGEPDRFGSGGNGNADQARQQAGAARESAIGHVFHSTNGRESVAYDDATLVIARGWFKAAIGSL